MSASKSTRRDPFCFKLKVFKITNACVLFILGVIFPLALVIPFGEIINSFQISWVCRKARETVDTEILSILAISLMPKGFFIFR